MKTAAAHSRPSAHVAPSVLESYFLTLRQHPMLSREEERELSTRFVETGDQRCADKLVSANLRLVVKIAFEYRTAQHDAADLVQEGNLGLIHAIKKYDPRRDVKLSTYAVWWIRAYILQFILSNARLVKVGTTQAQRRLFFSLRKERARMEGFGGAPVPAAQVAKALNVREKDVTQMDLRLAGSDSSLDAPLKNDLREERPYGERVAADAMLRPDVQSETAEFDALLKVQLDLFSSTLVGRDMEIFRTRLVSEEAPSLADLARKFGVSRERVRQLEHRLKDRLRGHLKASMGDALPV